DHAAHDALLAVAEGRFVADGDRRHVTSAHAFLSRKAMCERFEDLPEALSNTVEIARLCAVRPTTRRPILPRFTADGAESSEAIELRRQAEEGLTARLAVHGVAPGRSEADYRERLEYELGIIERMQFPGYFLIVADFIKWAKLQG